MLSYAVEYVLIERLFLKILNDHLQRRLARRFAMRPGVPSGPDIGGISNNKRLSNTWVSDNRNLENMSSVSVWECKDLNRRV